MPTWLSGFRRRPQTTTDLDRLTLEQLAKAGGDLTKVTETVHYLYLPTEHAARSAELELLPAGYTVEVRRAARGTEWVTVARIDAVPSEQNITVIRARFEDIANRMGGEYDGWEAAVTR